jgi:tight adherence protein B
MTFAIVIASFVLIGLCWFGLRQDSRQRRMNDQVAKALGSIQSTTLQIRLPQRRSKGFDTLCRILLNYTPDAPRLWPVSYAVIPGIVVMFIIIIGSILLAFPWWAIGCSVVAGCLVTRSLFTKQRRQYTAQLIGQLPDVVQLVVSAIRAGLPVADSFHIVAKEMPNPSKEQFALVEQDLSLGRTPEEALRGIYNRTKVDEYAMFTVTLAVQSKAGGRLAETLQIAGDTIRDRVALSARAKALAGEAKLSAIVLGAIPFAVGTMMFFIQPAAITPLFTDPFGRELLAIGATTLTLGILLMRQMIRKGTAV